MTKSHHRRLPLRNKTNQAERRPSKRKSSLEKKHKNLRVQVPSESSVASNSSEDQDLQKRPPPSKKQRRFSPASPPKAPSSQSSSQRRHFKSSEDSDEASSLSSDAASIPSKTSKRSDYSDSSQESSMGQLVEKAENAQANHCKPKAKPRPLLQDEEAASKDEASTIRSSDASDTSSMIPSEILPSDSDDSSDDESSTNELMKKVEATQARKLREKNRRLRDYYKMKKLLLLFRLLISAATKASRLTSLDERSTSCHLQAFERPKQN
jgi:hypothetical protein